MTRSNTERQQQETEWPSIILFTPLGARLFPLLVRSFLSRSSSSRTPSLLLLPYLLLFAMFARTHAHTRGRVTFQRDDLLDFPVSRFLPVAPHLRISRFGKLDVSRIRQGWAKSPIHLLDATVETKRRHLMLETFTINILPRIFRFRYI